MRARGLMLLAVGLLFAAPAAGDDDAKKDLDALQGTWMMTAAEINGEKLADEAAKEFKRVVVGNKMTITRGGVEVYQGTFKIDATKKPKTIDVTMETGNNKGSMLLGIYEVDGDTMKICATMSENPRPTEFSSKSGSMQTCAIWKKEKK